MAEIAGVAGPYDDERLGRQLTHERGLGQRRGMGVGVERGGRMARIPRPPPHGGGLGVQRVGRAHHRAQGRQAAGLPRSLGPAADEPGDAADQRQDHHEQQPHQLRQVAHLRLGRRDDVQHAVDEQHQLEQDACLTEHQHPCTPFVEGPVCTGPAGPWAG